MTKHGEPAEEGGQIRESVQLPPRAPASVQTGGRIVAGDGHGHFHQSTPLGDGELTVALPDAAIPPAARIEVAGAVAQPASKGTVPGSSAAAYGDGYVSNIETDKGVRMMSNNNKPKDPAIAAQEQAVIAAGTYEQQLGDAIRQEELGHQHHGTRVDVNAVPPAQWLEKMRAAEAKKKQGGLDGPG